MESFVRKMVAYFKEYRLIYIGAIICNISAFTFHRLLMTGTTQSWWYNILLALFFLLSFILPIALSIIFTARCFRVKSKLKLLIDIIHSYAGVLWIFAALYFQSMVFSDRFDSYRKNRIYESQIKTITEVDPSFQMMQVADRRAFKGIEKKLWSSYDYPSRSFIEANNDSTNRWYFLGIDNFNSITTEEIRQVISSSSTPYHPTYLSAHIGSVYVDCLYFSVICMATVGFGDISPALWYTKLFTILEVVIGMSIFVIAIGMLFSDFKLTDD